MFYDDAVIHIQSGHGGAGAVSFYANRKGPCGGKGGKGGDVIMEATDHMNSLEYFKYKQHLFAENGAPGGSNNITGKNGANCIIRVPIGTECHINGIKYYFIKGSKYTVLKGGRGGLGNGSFKSSCLQTPRFSQTGEPGQAAKVRLELKLAADIGLIGSPNAGKSSLICALTNAKSQIGSYAFTTIRPYQGMMNDICILDLPGIVQGAHTGKGLGIRFLKHAEHCKQLVLVADISDDPLSHVNVICDEIQKYGLNTPRYLILNKIDRIKNDQMKQIYQQLKPQFHKIFLVSTLYKTGLNAIQRYFTTNMI